MQLMTFSSFKSLQGILHFGHGHTSLMKIEPLLAHLHLNFWQHWCPGPWMAVDEGMVPFQGNQLTVILTTHTGRCPHRMHVPNKPDNTGLLVYMLGDCSGYLYDFYLSAGENRDLDAEGYSSISCVLKLLAHLPVGPPYRLAVDAFFGYNCCV